MATAIEKDTVKKKTAADLIRIGDEAPVEKSPSHWTLVWRRFQKNKLAIYGFFVILVVAIIAVLAPVISPDFPTSLDPLFDKYGGGGADERPSLKYPVGTDQLQAPFLVLCFFFVPEPVSAGLQGYRQEGRILLS